jgi:tetratricopeptide (TPR) repeat protein
VSLAVVAVCLGADAPWYATFVVAALGSLSLVALVAWRRLLRVGSRPVVFVAEFTPETPGAWEASLNHHRALLERLRGGALNDLVELRAIQAPLTEREADRLVEAVGARGVIYGRVQASGSAATYRGSLTAPRSWAGSEPEDHVAESQRMDVRASQTHASPADMKRPLEELVDERFEAHHVDTLEGTLLVRLAEEQLADGDFAAADVTSEAAAHHRAALSAEAVAHLVVVQARLRHHESLRDALLELEREGERDADHPTLWALLAVLAFFVHNQDELPATDFLRLAERAVNTMPDDPVPKYLRAHALAGIGKTGTALNELEAIADTCEFRDDFQFQMTRGALAYNDGRLDQAREAYVHATELQSTARAHLYLADTLFRHGDRDAARGHYLKALRLQPDLVDAWRGYWWEVTPAQREDERRGRWFDVLWNLIAPRHFIPKGAKLRLLFGLTQLLYRRHPEQERVHFMLGSQALLRGDLDVAEERLVFAYELTQGVDLECLGRLVMLRVQQGDLDEAETLLRRLREAPSQASVGPPSHDELRDRLFYVIHPALDEVRLVVGEPGEDLAKLLGEAFPEFWEELQRGGQGNS